jgi:signal transduction histidine kinase
MLDNSEPNFYTEEDAALALAFANHAAVAIENANLYREIRQYAEVLETRVAERTRELGALYEITAVSSQHLELQEIFDRVTSVITEALDCKAVSIQILDETGSVLHLAAHLNLAPQMFEYLQVLPVNNFTMKKLLEGSDAIIYVNPPSVSELSGVPLPETASYGVATSIRTREKYLGVLGVGYERRDPPTREDIALINSIADHIGVSIENARLQRQSEQLAVLEERERLARDLHDSATQSLFSLTLFAAAAREHLSRGQLESVQEQLVELEETSVQTHKEMRLLLYELRSTVLEEEGLVRALQRRIQMVEVRSGIRGHINAKLSSKLPVSVEQVLFQVANEALNNTLKHSGADTVTINITTDNSHVSMKIRDNGHGFATEDANFSAGMGMDNMRQRVGEMGGTFHHESQPTSGTTIVVHIPLVSEDSPGDG